MKLKRVFWWIVSCIPIGVVTTVITLWLNLTWFQMMAVYVLCFVANFISDEIEDIGK